jgi:hypothetical protein
MSPLLLGIARRCSVRHPGRALCFALLAWAAPCLAAWSPQGTPVGIGPTLQVEPQIAADRYGGAIVTWMTGFEGSYTAVGMAQRITARGLVGTNWPPTGVTIFASDSASSPIAAVPNSGASALAIWSTWSSSGVELHARSIWDDGTLGDVPATYDADLFSGPFLVTRRRTASTFVAWLQRTAGSFPRVALMALDQDGRTAQGWPAEGVHFGGGARFETPIALVEDSAGSAWVLTHERQQLYLYRADSTGLASGWPESGVPVVVPSSSPLFEVYFRTSLVPSANGVIVVYTVAPGASDDFMHVVTQRVDENGAVDARWPTVGRPVSSVVGSMYFPTATSDGEGGVIVAFSAGYTGLPSGLYVQRITKSGDVAPGWPAAGALVCRKGAGNPMLALDGIGGVFVSWDDYRAPQPSGPGLQWDSDIYAHRLLLNGSAAAGWGPDGSPVCNVRGTQNGAQIVPDGAGQALVAWLDYRDGNPDVYVSRIDASGFAGRPLSQPLSMRAPFPNPAKASASISFELARSAPVDVDVLDLSGRVVRTILEGNVRPFGRSQVEWDTADDDGRRVPSGIYFVRVRAPGLESTQRIAVVR